MPDLSKRTESMGMGQPVEAAPAYDDVMHVRGPATGLAHFSPSGVSMQLSHSINQNALRLTGLIALFCSQRSADRRIGGSGIICTTLPSPTLR